MLAACDPNVINAANVHRIEGLAVVGADYTSVRSALLAAGLREERPTFGPSRAEWDWDRCFMEDVSYLLSLAGGQRWVCMNLNERGVVIETRADSFVWGV